MKNNNNNKQTKQNKTKTKQKNNKKKTGSAAKFGSSVCYFSIRTKNQVWSFDVSAFSTGTDRSVEPPAAACSDIMVGEASASNAASPLTFKRHCAYKHIKTHIRHRQWLLQLLPSHSSMYMPSLNPLIH